MYPFSLYADRVFIRHHAAACHLPRASHLRLLFPLPPSLFLLVSFVISADQIRRDAHPSLNEPVRDYRVVIPNNELYQLMRYRPSRRLRAAQVPP